MRNKKYPIMELLPEGKENAISSEDLVEKINLKNSRELRLQIAKERNAGAIILSTTAGGYYRSTDREEIAEFIRTLEKRAKSTMKVLKSAKRYLKNVEGQMSMENVNVQENF